MADDFKYHIDHHASLRPDKVLADARDAYARGALDDAGVRSAEDAAISDVLRMQRRLGLAALSDGEFRRRNHLFVSYDGIEGFEPAEAAPTPFAQLVGPLHAPEVHRLAGLPRERGRLAKHETELLVSATQRSRMIALPSPGFLAELSADSGDVDAAGTELARIVRNEVAAIGADGVLYVLLTNPAYGFLLTAGGRARAAELGIDAGSILRRMLAADAAVLDGLATPPNFRIGLDLTTAGAAAGEYHLPTVREFLELQPFDRLCVEFPESAEQRFPIAELRPTTVVSLGVVNVSDPSLEDVDELVARVDAAAGSMEIDDIAISTNGGFHASRVTPTLDDQRSKLQLVEVVARYYWGNEL